MNIVCKYGIEIEIDRVLKMLDKFSWYVENGYNPTLPVGITELSSNDEVKNSIINEYNSIIYSSAESKILADWSLIQNKLYKVSVKYFPFVPNEIVLKLTKYGTYGSFQLPNFIVLDLNNKRGFLTIYHEFIHLCLEDELVRNKVSHWDKERIIDNILHSDLFNFLHYSFWQRDYHGSVERVDDIFKAYFFSNRDRFYSELCGR